DFLLYTLNPLTGSIPHLTGLLVRFLRQAVVQLLLQHDVQALVAFVKKWFENGAHVGRKAEVLTSEAAELVGPHQLSVGGREDAQAGIWLVACGAPSADVGLGQ